MGYNKDLITMSSATKFQAEMIFFCQKHALLVMMKHMCSTNDITKSPLIDTLDTTTGRPIQLLTKKSKYM